MNRVMLVGRITRDPELRRSPNGVAFTTFTIAVNRQLPNAQGERVADFINCVAFGRNGEFAEKYLRKGTKIVLTGRIQTGSYTNKDGAKVYTTDIVAEEFEFAESKNASAGNGDYSGFGGGSRPEPMSAGDGFMNIPDGIDEELPFN
jgi:single-strand DNA-binding protein